jgi:hypothetical protein
MLSECWPLPEPNDGASCSAADTECEVPATSPGGPAYSNRFDGCREWLDETHRRFVNRLFRNGNSHATLHEPHFVTASPHCIVFVPRSQPERAHTVDLRNLDSVALLAAFSKEQWFMQENAIDTALGPTGRLQVRLRAEWVIGPPSIKCASLRPRKEPECVVTATADLPLQSRTPRLLNCVICYDDARIAG